MATSCQQRVRVDKTGKNFQHEEDHQLSVGWRDSHQLFIYLFILCIGDHQKFSFSPKQDCRRAPCPHSQVKKVLYPIKGQ
jgi:hypothetical protein